MIKVTVPALPVKNMKGTGKASQKPYNMFFQTVYFHTADQSGQPLPFPEKAEIVLDTPKDATPDMVPGFAPGEYTLSPNSLYVGREGRLEVAPKLVPLKPRG
jgi:hypothetical protein